MDELLIEDMDDDLVRAVEQLALKNGRTFDAQVIHLLEKGLELEKQQKAISDVAALDRSDRR